MLTGLGHPVSLAAIEMTESRLRLTWLYDSPSYAVMMMSMHSLLLLIYCYLL